MAGQADYIYVLHAAREGMVVAGPDAREAEIVGRHFAYLQGLSQAGE